jgi:hypothetical protein
MKGLLWLMHRVSILHVATALSFTDAAAALRADLYKQLGSGQLPAITGPSSHGAAQDSPVLVAAAGCLCAVPSGAKLLAYLMKAVGLREPATIHVPGASEATLLWHSGLSTICKQSNAVQEWNKPLHTCTSLQSATPALHPCLMRMLRRRTAGENQSTAKSNQRHLSLTISSQHLANRCI